ncbi:MAG: hypothetical protein JXK16_02900 [Thiotrichales bacterium]|nr:hypothetical protein [Thiotrichales bacterium]
MIKKKIAFAVVFLSLSTGALAATNVLLYKHHSLTSDNIEQLVTANNNNIDPNRDDDFSDSNYSSPSQPSEDGVLNTPPTEPVFSATAYDGSGAILGVL